MAPSRRDMPATRLSRFAVVLGSLLMAAPLACKRRNEPATARACLEAAGTLEAARACWQERPL